MKIHANIPAGELHNEEVPHLQTGKAIIPGPLAYLLFAVVVFLLYSNTFQSPYIFDDWYHIEANPHIRMTSLSWDAVREAASDSPLQRRPVAYVSLALDYYFHGYDLWGYHLVNLLVHLGGAIFLYMFLETTLSLQEEVSRRSGPAGWLPFTAALLWLVHPLHIQSVTYIIQRMNSLAAMFFILAMLLYARGRLANGIGKQVCLFLGAACSGLLALGSKETAATLPFFILLYEWYFFQDLRPAWLRKSLLPILGGVLFLLFLVLLFLGLHPLAAITGSYGIRDFTMVQRLLTEFRVIIFYISLLLLPSPARLNIDHDFQVSLSLVHPMTTILSIGVLLVLLGLAIRLARRERLISFCILWFLGNLVIESSVIGLEIIFEHRTYLPSMLAVFAGVLLGNRFIPGKWPRVISAALVLLLFSTWTYQRNMVWQDEVALRRDAVAKSPAKPRALAILANALERNHAYDEAAYYYKETLRLNPKNANEIHYNLGNVLMAQGKLDAAVQNFREAVSLDPEAGVPRLNLAYALALQGKDSEASAELEELIRRHPSEPRGHNNLGLLLMKHGRLKEAVFHFTEALRLQPNYRQARSNLEKALVRLQGSSGRL